LRFAQAIGDVLYNRLGLAGPKRTKTGPSTDMEALEKLGNSASDCAADATIARW
jgi:DNA polymerase I-like protein with 3'-5' exonuclease and polymerase domains